MIVLPADGIEYHRLEIPLLQDDASEAGVAVRQHLGG